MRRLLKKCKDLAKMTHQSTSVANQQLKDKCKELGVKFTKLLNPCETRWNSYFDCGRSILRLKVVLQALFTDDESGVWSPHALSLSEWKLLQGAVQVLKPFWLTTKAWEAEKTPTLNLVIERVYTMHEELTDFIRDRHNCRFDWISRNSRREMTYKFLSRVGEMYFQVSLKSLRKKFTF